MSLKNFVISMSVFALFGLIIKDSASEEQFSGIFIITDITVHDDEAYQGYSKKVKPVIENLGGTFVVRAGGKFVTDSPTSGLLNASGDWKPDRIVVLHFDTKELG